MNREPLPPIGWSSDFIELDAASDAAQALETVRDTTAQWIVVQRAGGTHRYVFAVDELLEHPRLHGYRDRPADLAGVSLERILDLHEHQESTPTPRKEPLPPLRRDPHAPDAGPSVPRYVLTDAAGTTLGVGVAEAPRYFRGRGEPPRSATHGAELPAGASAEDEGRSPIRHPSIETDRPLLTGEPIQVIVDLLPTPTPSTHGGEITFGEQPEDWRTLQVGFQLISSGIVFETSTGEITVRRNQPSTPGVCRGRVRPDFLIGSRIDVTAVFHHAGRFCGTALRTFQVGDQPAAPTQGGVLVEVGAEPPDLTVNIMIPDPLQPGRLYWLVQPRERFDGLPSSLEGTSDVGQDAESYVAQLFKQYAQLDRGRHRRSIEGFGERLWEKAPSCFRDTYWALWDRLGQPFTIQFISADPNIPWELMRPLRDGDAHPLLALHHPVARWISSYRSYLRSRLPTGRLLTISPRYRSAAHRLTNAEDEAGILEQRLGAQRVDATYDAVLALLETASPPEPVALIHFAGHGRFEAGSVDSSTIQLEDGSLAVNEVARDAVKLGEACGTLVFFNACEVGAAGSALGAMGGWANALLKRHFGGFIAPLWAVDDEDATTVCSDLLEGIITHRQPVGSVLRGIREKYGEISPTFLSYIFYGDVNARVDVTRV